MRLVRQQGTIFHLVGTYLAEELKWQSHIRKHYVHLASPVGVRVMEGLQEFLSLVFSEDGKTMFFS